MKGPGYDADNAELHKWTAATLFMSLIVVHETFFGKLSKEKQEVLFRESTVYGTSLRMLPDMWPKTLDEFYAYWDENIANLNVTPKAVQLSRDLMYPRNIPLCLRPMGPMARV